MMATMAVVALLLLPEIKLMGNNGVGKIIQIIYFDDWF